MHDEVTAAARELSEHLMLDSKRRVVDPLIESVRSAIAGRFKAQGRRLISTGLPPLKSTLNGTIGPPMRGFIDLVVRTVVTGRPSSAGRKRINSALKKAHSAGAVLVAAQLGITEAARKPKTPDISEYIRDAEAIENDIDITTQERVRDIIDHGFSEKLGYAAVLDQVRRTFKDWTAGDSPTRADTIALTEVSRAYHMGGAAVASQVKATGEVIEKRWDAEPDACEVCAANADEEWIDAEGPFTSGDFEPEQHPNCRCSVTYRKAQG